MTMHHGIKVSTDAVADAAPLYRGIIPPLVTPLSDTGNLDNEGLGRLVDHVLTGGASGVFILGTTGEGPSLSYRVRRELITLACETVAGRVPVLVGITDTASSESLELSLIAADAGASAVVLAPPFYIPPSQSELVEYVRRKADKLPLPLVLYNIPQLTNAPFALDSILRLSEIDSIVGVKDSSGDLDYFARLTRIRAQRPDWSILMGPEHLLVDAIRLGGHGGVSGGANIFPELFVECYSAAIAGNVHLISQVQKRIGKLQQLYEVGSNASRYIRATKCALSVLGICDDIMAEPFQRFDAQQREQVRKVIGSYL